MKLTIIAKIRETLTRFLQPTRSECFTSTSIVPMQLVVLNRFIHYLWPVTKYSLNRYHTESGGGGLLRPPLVRLKITDHTKILSADVLIPT